MKLVLFVSGLILVSAVFGSRCGDRLTKKSLFASVSSVVGPDPRKIADKSRQMAGARVAENWAALFEPSAAYVADPVGAPRHSDLSLFFDTFIQPNDVDFELNQPDIVDPHTRKVIRIVNIIIAMGGERNGKATISVPTHVVYSLTPNSRRLESVEAYWELNKLGIRKGNILGFAEEAVKQFGRIALNHGVSFLPSYVFSLFSGQLLSSLMHNTRKLAVQGDASVFASDACVVADGVVHTDLDAFSTEYFGPGTSIDDSNISGNSMSVLFTRVVDSSVKKGFFVVKSSSVFSTKISSVELVSYD